MKRSLLLTFVLGIFALCGAGSCDKDDESVGEKMDNVGDATKDLVEDAGDKVEEAGDEIEDATDD